MTFFPSAYQTPILKELSPDALPPCMERQYSYLVQQLFRGTERNIRFATELELGQMCHFISKYNWSCVAQGTRIPTEVTGLPFEIYINRFNEFMIELSTPIMGGASSSMKRGVYWMRYPQGDRAKRIASMSQKLLSPNHVQMATVKVKTMMQMAEIAPNRFVKTYQAYLYPDRSQVFQEAFDGDLLQLMTANFNVRAHNVRLGRSLILKLVKDVAQDLKVLHDRNLVHRDVKPDNIVAKLQFYVGGMIHVEGHLTDFDFVTPLNQQAADDLGLEFNPNEIKKPCGTIDYCPPEFYQAILTRQSIADGEMLLKWDIWSLGVVLYLVLRPPMEFPWGEPLDPQGLLDKVAGDLGRKAGRADEICQLIEMFREGATVINEDPIGGLCARMMAFDPAARPSIDEVIEELNRWDFSA